MSLATGARIAPYETLSALGAGGMGEVYRARDSKLGRDVALKVLPEAFASDPDRVPRFHREAQVLAALNHPNIAAIHGFEDSGSIIALVMELVEWKRSRIELPAARFRSMTRCRSRNRSLKGSKPRTGRASSTGI